MASDLAEYALVMLSWRARKVLTHRRRFAWDPDTIEDCMFCPRSSSETSHRAVMILAEPKKLRVLIEASFDVTAG